MKGKITQLYHTEQKYGCLMIMRSHDVGTNLGQSPERLFFQNRQFSTDPHRCPPTESSAIAPHDYNLPRGCRAIYDCGIPSPFFFRASSDYEDCCSLCRLIPDIRLSSIWKMEGGFILGSLASMWLSRVEHVCLALSSWYRCLLIDIDQLSRFQTQSSNAIRGNTS